MEKNQEYEYFRNSERFTFLKWGAKAFKNLLIVPPGSGIVHQVNLEYLARVVFAGEAGSPQARVLYPDSVVGTDSHTTMINGLGVCGWGMKYFPLPMNSSCFLFMRLIPLLPLLHALLCSNSCNRCWRY